jgi:hypothetical protein
MPGISISTFSAILIFSQKTAHINTMPYSDDIVFIGDKNRGSKQSSKKA